MVQGGAPAGSEPPPLLQQFPQPALPLALMLFQHAEHKCLTIRNGGCLPVLPFKKWHFHVPNWDN